MEYSKGIFSQEGIGLIKLGLTPIGPYFPRPPGGFWKDFFRGSYGIFLKKEYSKGIFSQGGIGLIKLGLTPIGPYFPRPPGGFWKDFFRGSYGIFLKKEYSKGIFSQEGIGLIKLGAIPGGQGIEFSIARFQRNCFQGGSLRMFPKGTKVCIFVPGFHDSRGIFPKEDFPEEFSISLQRVRLL